MARSTGRLALRITIVLALAALVALAFPGCESIATALLTATGLSGAVLAYLTEARHAA